MSGKNQKKYKIPMRKCIGCNESKDKSQLTRIAFYEGKLSVDRSGRAKGRGVYICKNEECRREALKRGGLARSFKTNFDKALIEEIFRELENE